MAAHNFDAVMAEIFKHEGGYVDHPADPGGATNLGVTFAVLQKWRGKPITKADVKALTKKEATEIYRKNYWNPTKCDDLPAGVDLVMMDGSVNSGIGRGPKWIQAAVGATQDGNVGTMTLRSVMAAKPAEVINRACDVRLSFLKGLKTWPTFGKGWGRRVEGVRKRALEMANAKPVEAPMKLATVNLPTGESTITVPPKKVDHGTTVVAGAGVLGAALLAVAKGLGWF